MLLTARYRPWVFPAMLLLLYAAFCIPMIAIVLQYVPARTDTAFLGIKQEQVLRPWYLPVFYLHVFTGILALPAGLTQFSGALRRRFPALHRLQGKLYAGAILLAAAPSGFAIGLLANGGTGSQISFCLLAVLWFFSTLRALQTARRGNFTAHRAWMYRSFALTLSAITLRAWKWLLVALFQPHPIDVYRIVAWLGWVLNLAIAEYVIQQKRTL
jgi:uncharacterized membrane protein